MNTLLEQLKRLLAGQKETSSQESGSDFNVFGEPAINAQAYANDQALARLMLQIEQTKEGEYRCEETLDLLDEYAELEVSDRDAARLMPLVKGHLDHCVDCTERYESLLRILEDS